MLLTELVMLLVVQKSLQPELVMRLLLMTVLKSLSSVQMN